MRQKLFEVVVAFLVGALCGLLLTGCGGGGVTGPSDVDISSTSTGEVASVSPPVAHTQPDLADGCDYNITLDGEITISCTRTTKIVRRAIHYFVNGPQPQERLRDSKRVTIEAGGTYSESISLECESSIDCEKQVKLQVDVTKGYDDYLTRPSNDLGHIYAVGYPVVTGTRDCGEVCEEDDYFEFEVVYGEWTPCTERAGGICARDREVKTIRQRYDGCTKEPIGEPRIDYDREVVECDSCPSQLCSTPVPEFGTVLTWSGRGDPITECQAFGNFIEALPPNPPAFAICKAGNDREVVDPFNLPTGVCPTNGKDISHITLCMCADD